MVWKKLGLIFSPDKHSEWMHSHAANPVAMPLSEKDGIVRVYFSSRNENQKASIAWADVDFDHDFAVKAISIEPLLSRGTPGYFDDDGVSMSWILQHGNQYLLYYLGWNLRTCVPWLNTIGLAVADHPDGPFRKYSRAPIMDRHHLDPFTVSYPCVLQENGRFRMWYGSNLSWGREQHEMAHVIKYAESADGINWQRSGEVHIGLEHPGEYAISKPCVIRMDEGYRMFYSFRASEYSDKYRIGTAWSSDGFAWKREDENAGITVSESGWDSESIEYPNVFRFRDKLYLLYNGNQYGKTGFGLAILEEK
jgi:predicted GH43/DUF377 family glycosyl hydrolase